MEHKLAAKKKQNKKEISTSTQHLPFCLVLTIKIYTYTYILLRYFTRNKLSKLIFIMSSFKQLHAQIND